jgi:hypothetical protein
VVLAPKTASTRRADSPLRLGLVEAGSRTLIPLGSAVPSRARPSIWVSRSDTQGMIP